MGSGPVSKTTAWCQTTSGLVAPALPCLPQEGLHESFVLNQVLLDSTSFWNACGGQSSLMWC